VRDVLPIFDKGAVGRKIKAYSRYIGRFETVKIDDRNIFLQLSLNESIALSENLQVFSHKEVDQLQAKMDKLENEKADQEIFISREFAGIKELEKQLVAANEELTKNKIIAENAIQEKIAVENKLTVIQELWDKQQVG